MDKERHIHKQQLLNKQPNLESSDKLSYSRRGYADLVSKSDTFS